MKAANEKTEQTAFSAFAPHLFAKGPKGGKCSGEKMKNKP
jgi:hypothetical protein